MAMYPLLIVYGQDMCPFSGQEAIADTLDPKGYFPFEIGLQREYVRKSGAFLESLSRHQVISDTLISEDVFYKILTVIYDASSGVPIISADTGYTYKSVLNGVLYQWAESTGKRELSKLSQYFNTCYDIDSQNNAAVVEGGYESQYTFQGQDPISLPAGKNFTYFGIATENYGHGIGLLQKGGDPSVNINLTYFRNGNVEYGKPLEELYPISVSSDQDVLPHSEVQVDIFPNPFPNAVTIRYSLQNEHYTTLTIFNLLGQEVNTLISEFQAPGQRELVWEGIDNSGNAVPGGVYLFRLHTREISQSGLIVYTK